MTFKEFTPYFWRQFNRLTRFIFTKIFGFLHVPMTERKWEEFLTFARFWFIGMSSSLVSYVTNVIVLLIINLLNSDFEIDFAIANISAFITSVLWTYYWNNNFVFVKGTEEDRSAVKSFVKMVCTYAFTGIILNNVLSYVWIYVAGISKYTAPVLNLLIGFPVNFIMNRLWAFK